MANYKFSALYTAEQLGIAPVSFSTEEGQTLTDRINAVVSNHVNGVVVNNPNTINRLFRTTLGTIVTAYFGDLVEDFGYEIFCEIRPMNCVSTDTTISCTKWKVEDNAEIDYSIVKEVFENIDWDAVDADLDSAFEAALIREAQKMAPVSIEEQPIEQPIEEPIEDPIEDPIEEEPIEDYSDDEEEDEDNVPAEDDIEDADVIEDDTDDDIDDVPDEEEPTSEQQSTPEWLKDPLAIKYAKNFADAFAIKEVQDAVHNSWEQKGNHVELNSLMFRDNGYSFVATFRYDSKNKGKDCRSIEHDGNKTTVYDWRTPTLFGWALSTIGEDGGEFSREVLGKALTQASCKKHGIPFVKTSTADRNAARGKSGQSKQTDATKPVSTQPAPKAEQSNVEQQPKAQKPIGVIYVNPESDEIWFVADPTAERSEVYIVVDGVIEERDTLKTKGDGNLPGVIEHLEANGFHPTADPATMQSLVKAGVPIDSVAIPANEQPIEEPEHPIEEPEQPIEEPEQPIEEPEQPIEEPEQPIEESIEEEPVLDDTSEEEPLSPSNEGDSVADTPAPEHPNAEPSIDLANYTDEELALFQRLQDPEYRKMAIALLRDDAATRAQQQQRQRHPKRRQHKLVHDVMRRLNHGKPAYLYGKAGTGKNVIAEQCAELLGIPLAPVNCLFDKFEVTGFATANGKLSETTIVKAIMHGWLLFLDEFDTSDPRAVNTINSLLANGYIDVPVYGRLYAHKNFRVIAAGNTNGRGGTTQYTGRVAIDAATLNRFKLFEVGYDVDVEMSIAEERGYGKDEVEFIEDFRQACEACSLEHLVSYRQLADLLDELDDHQKIADAIRAAIVRDMEFDDFRTVCECLKKARNPYTRACYKMKDLTAETWAA